MQQGLLPAHKKQHAAPPEAIPCSPVAAAPQHTADEQPCTPCRRTPLSQLRAEVSAAEDSSPCNNIVRRLAADISQDSPALQVTLNEYRRSTASRHSSFVHRDSRQSNCSLDEHLTPAASPGRGWVQPPTATQWDTPEFDLQGSTCHFPTSPSSASCCSESQAGAQALGAAKGPAGTPGVQQQQAAADIPEGLAAAATSSVPFMGFGAPGAQDPALMSADSAKLTTPRLVELRCTSVSSSFSSSNSTVSASHEEASTSVQQEAAAAVQSSAAALTDKQFLPAVTTSTAANEHASKRATEGDTSVPSAAVGSGATGSIETAGSSVHAAGSHAGLSMSAQTAHLPIDPAFVETGFWGSRDGSSNGTVTMDHTGSHSPLGAASQVRQHDGGIISHADSGFLSCDEDMELQETLASILHSTGQQSPQAAAHAGRQATAAVVVGGALQSDMQAATAVAAGDAVESSEPCQLPLSPLLLRQLSQQLSFKEAAADSAAPGSARSEGATSCCDWATVYSYEGGDS